VSLTAKEAMVNGTLESCGTVQTMHNPFDSEIGMGDLEDLVSNDQIRRRIWDRDAHGGNYGDMTAYAVGLGLVDAPIAVVSEHFADQFRSDILHTQYYAPHLQQRFARGLVGINNGPFVPFAREFPRRENHTPAEAEQIKQQQREALLEILDSYNPESRFGNLTYEGGSIRNLPSDVPILVMTGRLDPCQRGYDVFLKALEAFERDEVKVVMGPMAINQSDLDYFYEVAAKCDGNLTVFPIRMEKGFRELQCGATFSVWPSIYEPFGGAIEYMANGTPVIVRESGGLVNQVDPGVSGFRYLEPMTHYSIDNLRGFFACKDIVQSRKTNPWFQDMVAVLKSALDHSIRIFREEPNAYHQMILNGFKKAKKFSWEKNTDEYLGIYSLIGRL
jgi:glycosyltransferase involved in cell wall biosynthesis